MQVVLSANIPHYIHAATALQAAGLLTRYITAFGVKDPDAAYLRLLPAYWRSKVRSRAIEGVDPARLHLIRWPEMVQKGALRSGVLSAERANWLNNHLYDRLAARALPPCDVFHGVSSVSLYTAQRAKARGARFVCDERAAHPDVQNAILQAEHDKFGLPYTPIGVHYDAKMKAEYALADRIVVPSGYARDTFVAQGIDGDSLWVVPYGVNHTYFCPGPEPARMDGFRVLFAGQVRLRKGIPYLVEAFKRVARKHWRLQVAGRVEKAFALWMQQSVAGESRIDMLGNVPKDRLRQLYRTCDVMVLPSLTDSWGLVAAEAMACGVPVIVSEHTGANEMVEDGENGFIVPIRDADAIADRLVQLADDRDRCRELGRMARRTAVRYGWGDYGQRLVALYQTLAQSGTGD